MTDVTVTTTLGDAVTAKPGAAAIFERLDLDYCCGGDQNIEDACREHALDADEVLATINALSGEPTEGLPEAQEMAAARLDDLCQNIVVRHHGPLRVTLVRLQKLVDTVARVHGAEDPMLVELQAGFTGLRGNLEEHMLAEEQSVFPAIAQLDAGSDAEPLDVDLLAQLRDDHRDVGSALGVMRTLCDGYDQNVARCRTHGAMLGALEQFEVDMRTHVHLENSVLFPRAAAANAELVPPPPEGDVESVRHGWH